MATIVVLADDLTGTLDCAVQFSKQNIDVSVCNYDSLDGSSMINSAPVLVVNTDSRHIAPHEAAGRVRRITELAVQTGVNFYYKKIDSLLRGNIGAECEALLCAAGRKKMFLLPAFPDNGRYTRGGCQYYGDKPVTESVLGKDRFSKQLSSSLPELFRLQNCGVQTRVVGISEPLPKEQVTEPTVYVFDAETNGQLRERAVELKNTQLPWVAAGCAGFAEVIPLALGLESGADREIQPVSKALVVSGSINPISIEQVRNIDSAGYKVLYLSYEQIRERPEMLEKIISLARKELRQSGTVIVATSGDADGTDLMKEKDAMCSIMAAAAAGIIDGIKDCALVVFGGDTSLGIIQEMRVKEIKPVCEIAPGVVCSTLVVDDGSKNVFITKSGGFGGKDTIVEILSFLNLKQSK